MDYTRDGNLSNFLGPINLGYDETTFRGTILIINHPTFTNTPPEKMSRLLRSRILSVSPHTQRAFC